MSIVQHDETQNGATGPEVGEVIDAPRHMSKDDWLTGTGDLEQTDVEVPGLDGVVTIRGLSAGMASAIQNESMKMKNDEILLDTRRRQVLTFKHGVIDPQFTAEEVNQIVERWGPAFQFVVSAIDEISKSSPEALEAFRRRFRPGR